MVLPVNLPYVYVIDKEDLANVAVETVEGSSKTQAGRVLEGACVLPTTELDPTGLGSGLRSKGLSGANQSQGDPHIEVEDSRIMDMSADITLPPQDDVYTPNWREDAVWGPKDS